MINRLHQVQERKGPKYVNDILDENVVITEKIDTFRLIFQKKDNEIVLYKKDNSPITLTERTLSDIYEEAILEIPLITHEAEIPEGYAFGFYYTPVERPLRIPYSKLPKYILTDVTRRDKNSKIVESLDYEKVKEWAAVLCMGRPPVIFEGKLDKGQKKTLIQYDSNNFEGEMSTFPQMIERLFGTTYSQEDIIEGIIIKSKSQISQIISYEFDLLNEAYEKANESRDFYDIIISDLNEFLNSYNIPMLEAESKDELYLNIVCNIFNNYCEKRLMTEGIEEKSLTPPQFGYYGKLNKRFIKNEDTLEWLEKSPVYEALFKVFISSFRKYKKPYGLLTEAIVNRFNSYVNLINGYVNGFDNVNENLNESRSDNIVIDAVKKRNPSDVDNMRVIASIQKAFEPKIRDVIRGNTPCAVYITTLEPFTNSQMDNVIRIKNMWNAPVVIFAVGNKHKIEGKDFHASDSLMKAQMQALMNYDNSLIPGFGILDSWNITEIFEFCRPDFEPVVIITDKGKKSEMTLQLFFEEEIMGGRINVEDKFNIGELENEDRLASFRAVEDNNASMLLELTPPPIHNVLDQIFNEYRLWSGQMLKPIHD